MEKNGGCDHHDWFIFNRELPFFLINPQKDMFVLMMKKTFSLILVLFLILLFQQGNLLFAQPLPSGYIHVVVVFVMFKETKLYQEQFLLFL